jgi:hypothetical protein
MGDEKKCFFLINKNKHAMYRKPVMGNALRWWMKKNPDF